MKKNIFCLAVLASLFCTLCSSTTIFPPVNLVVNGTFENPNAGTPNPKGYCHTPGSDSWGGQSPAANWVTWINNPTENSCMITELVSAKSCKLPPAPPSSGVDGNLMHVVSTIGHAGIAQNPLPERKKVLVTCWVYVVRGKVGIGAGNGGNTSTTSISQSICKWEKLTTTNSVSPANNVCIYAQYATPDADGAEFYVDNVVVEEL